MKKIVIFSILFICTAHTNAMLIPHFSKDLNNKILNEIPTSQYLESLNEVSHVMSTLAQTDKSLEFFINDTTRTLTWIKQLSTKFNCSNMAVTEKLCTQRAQSRFALQTACLQGWRNGDRVTKTSKLNRLKKGGLDLNFTYDTPKDDMKPTILIKITSQPGKGYSDIGKWFIKNGADINIINNTGMNAPMLALCYFNQKLIPLFLNHPQFQVNSQDIFGNTLLHHWIHTYAVNSNLSHPLACKIIKQLLKKGANPYCPNNKNETPHTLAKKLNFPKFVALLEDKK